MSKAVTNKQTFTLPECIFLMQKSEVYFSQANKSLKNNSQIKIHGVSKKDSQEM